LIAAGVSFRTPAVCEIPHHHRDMSVLGRLLVDFTSTTTAAAGTSLAVKGDESETMPEHHCGSPGDSVRRRRVRDYELRAPQYRFSRTMTVLIAILVVGIVVIYAMIASR
jgi:hypothetical protein